ncbi:hypothetical protein SAMD00019534_062560 [Acytostelium subglobosum LB1]|uniref:hypothetical protein n=1 Tax=Acytostelium subglobosum LB1 TaxID=1410327 RepID=UPI000644F9A3|nr:hypothetical protein SAMD00019534_062560 [Acytostelium subglobosum LB1]GAM23081.1 hypothetical protein SAMD00019534_062560 [Acytostelium subglobosum LB1]|eukprot:XP_012754308.1 hypothetical protein SAMD00019534_062560 [Acytostelium subglobosum LB1]
MVLNLTTAEIDQKISCELKTASNRSIIKFLGKLEPEAKKVALKALTEDKGIITPPKGKTKAIKKKDDAGAIYAMYEGWKGQLEGIIDYIETGTDKEKKEAFVMNMPDMIIAPIRYDDNQVG